MIKFTLRAPRIASLRAKRALDLDERIDWHVDYAPEDASTGSERVVFGTLHLHSEQSVVELTVVGLLGYEAASEFTSEEFEAGLRESEAVETLYDIVRMAILPVAAQVECDVRLPVKAPSAIVGLLERRQPESSEHEH